MSVVCVVQARTGSSRLPGKVLADVGGVPLLGFMLRRLRGLPGPLVVATTDDPGDDPVEDVAEEEGATVVRGPGDDVLGRFALVLDRVPAAGVVRLTGDCPLADPDVVARAVALWERSGADYVSNTLVRTFPDGLDVEVVDAAALRSAATEAADPVEREHVTPFVYRRPERYALRSLRHRPPLGHLRWTVDTQADLDRVRRIVRGAGRTDFTWREAVGVPAAGEGAVPIEEGDVALRPALPHDEAFLLQLRNDDESIHWSRSGQAVDPAGHAVWFATVLDDPSSRVWIAQRADGVLSSLLGQVRVDIENGVGTLSIAVADEARGQGIGSAMLRLLRRSLACDHQVHTLVAQVHEDNVRSRRLFDGAGFAPGSREDAFLTYSLPRSDW